MNKSEQINELATALSKAQGVMETAKKTSTNPFFKSQYADLASVWEACRKPLSDNGLSILQTLEDGKVETILLHTSGQYVSSVLAFTAKDQTSQSIGSAITYARRYALSAMVGICPDDDDAEAAMGRSKNKPVLTPPMTAEDRAAMEVAVGKADADNPFPAIKPNTQQQAPAPNLTPSDDKQVETVKGTAPKARGGEKTYTDPEMVKTVGDLFTACKKDFNLLPDFVLKEINKKSRTDITNPMAEYLIVAGKFKREP